MDTGRHPVPDTRTESTDGATPTVRLESLAWTPPGESAPVFFEVDLAIEPGDRLIFQGPSGSGKTSILRCIAYLEKPTEGTVFWGGQPVEPDRIRDFRRNVVYLQQRPSPVGETVGEDMAFAREMAGRTGRDDEQALAAQKALLEKFGLSGLDFEQPFDQLSVGEQQRVAIVRALSLSPQVLLLDEPTSALDPERVASVERHLVDYVDSNPQSRSYIWVTHSPAQTERLGGRTVSIGELNGHD